MNCSLFIEALTLTGGSAEGKRNLAILESSRKVKKVQAESKGF
jgi:hypothetical protein